MSADWADLIKIVIGAGIGTAIVQGVFALVRDEREKKSKADFLALQIALNLEEFARQLAELDSENEFAEHFQDREFPNWSAKLPNFDPLPDDVEGWRSLDQNVVGSYFNLKSKREDEQKSIGQVLEIIEHDLEEYVAIAADELGSRALKLANEIRTRHRLLLSRPDTEHMQIKFTARAKWANERLEAKRQEDARN